MPVSLAIFAGTLREKGFECSVIDAFGENPTQFWFEQEFLIRGLTFREVAKKILPETKAIILYASNLTCHRSLMGILNAIRPRFPNVPIILMENTQAVTAYSLRHIQQEMYDLGVDYIITGEAEERGVALLQSLQQNGAKREIRSIEGIGFRENGITYYTPPVNRIKDLDALPFPAWDLLPLESYWRLKYAHGPFETKRYLPLLTSRGCPFPCNFCVIPETNNRTWRSRSPKNVVDEMEIYSKKFGVREFHIEDLNPTVNESRIREFCQELIKRKLDVLWKISAGTKAETIKNESTIELMSRAGCRYISISPESGSPRVLKLINKTFEKDHVVKLIHAMNRVGIHSQACFVLGFPGEKGEDLQMTLDLVHDLTRVGIDEIALFVIAPVPGSSIYDHFSGYKDYSQLSFSPRWREDYKKMNYFRVHLYKKFLFWKLCYHPQKVFKQAVNVLLRKFETKMEMTAYRGLHTTLLWAGLIGKEVGYEN